MNIHNLSRWRRALGALVMAACLTQVSEAVLSGGGGGEVALQWNPNPEEYLAGYRVLYGLASGTYTQAVDVGNVTTFTLSGLTAGQVYYSVVVAYGTEGQESPPSDEITFIADPALPPFAVEALPAPSADDPALTTSAPTVTDWAPLPTGGFGFTITAAPGKSLAVYASHDMLNWALLSIVSNTTGRLRAVDNEAGQLPGRYYQILPAP